MACCCREFARYNFLLVGYNKFMSTSRLKSAGLLANSRLRPQEKSSRRSQVAPTSPPLRSRVKTITTTPAVTGKSVKSDTHYQVTLRSLNKLRQAIFWYLVSIIIIPLVFLLFVFPLFVFTSAKINSKKYQAENLVVRPQMPSFDVPPAFTNQAEQKIHGFASSEHTVQFIVNGQSLAENQLRVGISGEFTFIFKLRPGENTLAAYSQDSKGEKSAETKTYTTFLDQEVPELQLKEPVEKNLVGRDKQLLTVAGTTEPLAKVLVNSVQTTSNDQGEFSLSYPLQEGENQLTIAISDRAGNMATWEEIVNYKP